MKVLAENKREFFVAGAIVAVALVAHFVFAYPRFQAARRDRDRVRELDAAIQQSSLRVDEMSALFGSASDVEDLSVQDDEEILPALLDAIAAKGEEHGVRIVAMKPAAQERVELAGEPLEGFRAESTRLVVSVTVTARYRSLGRYLESLETIPVLVAVRNLRIARGDEDSGLLKASFDIETYSIRTDEKTD